MRATTPIVAVVAVVALAACGPEIRRFPLAEPLTDDPDREHVEERPEEYYSPFAWDAIDQTIFRPLTRVFAVDPAGRAVNVNAFDEVPNSSWFQNRIGLGETAPDGVFTPEDARRGACPESRIDWSGPWSVTDAKPNGANPGFLIRAADGRRYLLKFDGHLQPLRATSADVFGSRLYHAVGFHSPCNFVVTFDPSEQLVMDPEAETTNSLGQDVPMTEDDVQQVLDAAYVMPDGQLRASASLFLSGRPIGPWTYQDTRCDDPNDVIDHDDRRELRGGRVLASWVNHFDAREQNTLAVWVEEDDRHYVRHYYIDFGDGFGSDWEIEPLTRRIGHANYLDLSYVLEDFLTLGLVPRPWYSNERSEAAWIYGYYDVVTFEPTAWEPGYPNPAFDRMREGDAAWMARIMAHFSDEHVRAMLDEAHIAIAEYDTELYHTLLGRLDRILATWLRVRSPLAHFEVVAESPFDGAPESAEAVNVPEPLEGYIRGGLPEGGDRDGQWLCFTDLAAMSGVWSPSEARYVTRTYIGDWEEPVWQRIEPVTQGRDGEGRVCVALVEGGLRPAADAAGASPDAPERYAVVDVFVHPIPGDESIPPARLHFYDVGEEALTATAGTGLDGQAGFVLVGIERPEDADPPYRE